MSNHPSLRSALAAACLFLSVIASTPTAAEKFGPRSPSLDLSSRADPPARVDADAAAKLNVEPHGAASADITRGQSMSSGSVNIAKPNLPEPAKFNIGTKIEGQMAKRGWDRDSIQKTIRNPHRTEATKDTRYKQNGETLNDPATAYIRKDEHYVVKNNKTDDIVAISDINNLEWKSPFREVKK